MFNINFIVTLEKDEYRIVPEVPSGPVNLKSFKEVRNHQHRDGGFPEGEWHSPKGGPVSRSPG